MNCRGTFSRLFDFLNCPGLRHPRIRLCPSNKNPGYVTATNAALLKPDTVTLIEQIFEEAVKAVVRCGSC